MAPIPTRGGDDRGQILILAAVSMTALLGIAALSIDASFMYDKRNRLHAAADAAAKTGAIEVHRNPTVPLAALRNFANQQVIAHGFNPSGSTTVTIHHPPINGPFTGNIHYVEAIVSEPTATFFGVILGIANMTPGARAVAGTSPGLNCLITLNGPGTTPTSMSVGNTTLNMPGCSVANNGDLSTTNPNATITAQSVGLTGSCFGQHCPQANQQTGVPPVADPLIALAAPTNPGGCTAQVNPTSLPGGCYSSITTSVGQTLTLTGGVYYITGRFELRNNVRVVGTGGVLIVLAGTAPTGPCGVGAIAGCFDAGQNTRITLTAQTSGPYSGIVLFQDRTNHLDFNFNNSVEFNLQGAVYLPGADVSFRNGFTGSNDCTLMIARSFLINNGNGLFSNTCSAFGGSPILTVTIAE